MLKVLLIASALIVSSASNFAQVTIDNYYAETGDVQVASGPVTASFTTPYTTTFGESPTAVTVIPNVSGDLSKGTFVDGISLSGMLVPPCECTGSLAVYLPNLTLENAFDLTGATGQVIPWSFTEVITPTFGIASANVFDSEIDTSIGAGGNVASTSISACFTTAAVGCSQGVYGPNGRTYDLTISGTIISGGELDIISNTSGNTEFVQGPGASTVSGSLALDPSMALYVPAGVAVQSSVVGFPVGILSTVPEPGSLALMLIGIVVMLGSSRPSRLTGSTPDGT